jgi:hypothetical protein
LARTAVDEDVSADAEQAGIGLFAKEAVFYTGDASSSGVVLVETVRTVV